MFKIILILIFACINTIGVSSNSVAIYEEDSKYIRIIDSEEHERKKILLSLEFPLQDFYLSKDILVVADNLGKIRWKNINKDAWNIVNRHPFKYKEKEKWGIERFKDVILIKNDFILFVYGPEYERVKTSSNSFSKKRMWDKTLENRSYYDLTNIGVYSIKERKLLDQKINVSVYVQTPFLVENKLIIQKSDDILVIDLDSSHQYFLGNTIEPRIDSTLSFIKILGINENQVILGSFSNSAETLNGLFSYSLETREMGLIKRINKKCDIKDYEICDLKLRNNILLLLKKSKEIVIFNFDKESFKKIYKTTSRVLKTHFVKY